MDITLLRCDIGCGGAVGVGRPVREQKEKGMTPNESHAGSRFGHHLIVDLTVLYGVARRPGLTGQPTTEGHAR
jgi:hypothetical protein